MESPESIDASTPLTMTRLQAGFDLRAWTDVEILNPALALIDRRRYLGILLAKDMSIEPAGTLLRGVRWIRLLLGWRLNMARFISRCLPVHLPDEWLFNEVSLALAANGMFVARLNPFGLVLPTPNEWPYPTKALTAGQYRLLANASGRLLQAQVSAMFHEFLGLDGERALLRAEPSWPEVPIRRIFAG